MRLLMLSSQDELSLTNDLIDNIPQYAILSHTWGADADEVTFADLCNGLGRDKLGYTKIKFCGQQARNDGIQHFWVDTCCIDKANNTELSEAINSMFRWYSDSVKCYVYLSDVSTGVSDSSGQGRKSWEADFRVSKWFTRGWTLQELLAPKIVEFFSEEKTLLGDKKLLAQQIHEITDIPLAALYGTPLQRFSISERQSWASKRKTRREEDQAYCLLGILGIFMPLIYGERENALVRLQQEISRRFSSHTAVLRENKRPDSNPSIQATANGASPLRAETRITLSKRTRSTTEEDGRKRTGQPCKQKYKAPHAIGTISVSMALPPDGRIRFKSGKFCNKCRLTEKSSVVRFGEHSLLFRRSKLKGQDCATHQYLDVSRTTIKYRQRLCLLPGIFEVMFLIVLASGIPSLSVSLKPEVRCEVLPLSSFFRKLYDTHFYSETRSISSTRSTWGSRKPASREKQDYLISVARKQILQAYQTGIASPQDVDRRGKNLLHLQIELAHSHHEAFLAQMIRLLLSIGFKGDHEDDNFCNVQKKLVQTFVSNNLFPWDRRPPTYTWINDNIFEWIPCTLPETSDVVGMLDCIRRWPESSADWGYPRICDIIIRKSIDDLELYLQKQPHVTEKDFRRITPLHLTAAECWPEGTELLLTYGADKYAQDAQGNFALDIAIWMQCVPVVELLLREDCMPYICRKTKNQKSTLPRNFLKDGLHNNQALQSVIVKALARHRKWLKAARPYHDLARNRVDCSSIAEKLLTAGFGRINEYDEHGFTPLMHACCIGNASMVAFLLKSGADPSKNHQAASLRAGHFCFFDGGSYWVRFDFGHLQDGKLNPQQKAKLLGPAYDIAPLVESRCRCSPEGFSPINSSFKADLHEPFYMKRRTFETLVTSLRLSHSDLRQRVRSFVRMEIFDRLDLPHTCIRQFPNVRKFPEEDRVEIEEEQEELYAQLDALMSDFEMWQENFGNDVMNCMDSFFDDLDHNLQSRRKLFFLPVENFDHDILGRGTTAKNHWMSSRGEYRHDHKEGRGESYMLQCLYG